MDACLEDWSEELLELSGVPMLAAAADGVVADDNLPGRLGLDQGVVQILNKLTFDNNNRIYQNTLRKIDHCVCLTVCMHTSRRFWM